MTNIVRTQCQMKPGSEKELAPAFLSRAKFMESCFSLFFPPFENGKSGFFMQHLLPNGQF